MHVAVLLLASRAGAETAAVDPTAPTVGASLDRTEAHVGDRLTLTLSAVARDVGTIQLPRKLELGKFELLDSSSTDRDLGEGRRSRRFLLQIAAYDVGELELPPIAIEYRGNDGRTHTVATTAIPVQIRPVVEDPKAELQPLRGQRPVMVEDRRPVQAMVAVGAAAAAVGAAYAVAVLLRRRKRRPAAPAPVVVRPPHEVALERLRELRARGGFAADGYQPFHFEVAEVVRAYLGGRFGFDSLELTTTELMEALRQVVAAARQAIPAPAGDASAAALASPVEQGDRETGSDSSVEASLSPRLPVQESENTGATQSADALVDTDWRVLSAQLASIASFLEACDLVKFAKAPSNDLAAMRVLDAAEGIVTSTMPAAAPAAAAVAHG